MNLDKKDVRHELLQIRKAFAPAEVVAKSQQVCEHILQSELYAKAHCIMGFWLLAQKYPSIGYCRMP
jgi:5-formyltetrahydrofolate cyclo-ligase